MTNATGWNDLIDGNMVKAAFNMYDFYLNGWTMAILFITYMIMLWQKTHNQTLCWVVGVFFVVLYGALASQYVKPISMYIIFLILVFQLGGIIFMLLWK
jgi:hypothetical protein